MYEFEYRRPITMAGAIDALKREEAKALAGGQSLTPTLKQRLARPSVLVDLKALPDLRGISVSADAATVKAGTSHAEVARDAEIRRVLPALADLAGRIGDPQVRNRGTLGGSIANNDPSACYPAAVLALGATVVTSEREIAADDYFRGLYETALKPGELITAARFPIPTRAAYQKFAQPASRFALTGVFVAQFPSGVRVAVTGAGESGVFRHDGLEQALSANFAPEAAAGVAVASAGLIEDLHGSPAYRADLIRVLAERAVRAALG